MIISLSAKSIIFIYFLEYLNLKLVQFFNKLSVVFNIFINLILYIEILNLKIFLSIMIRLLELLILDFLILIEKIKGLKLHVDLHVMLLHKWFKEKIDIKQSWWIFGAVELYYMQCFAVVYLFRIHKRLNYIKKY